MPAPPSPIARPPGRRRCSTPACSSRDQYETAQHAADTAHLQIATAQTQVAQALANLGGENISEANNPTVMQAKAAVDKAQISVNDGTITAPQDGVVTRVEQLQVGSYINSAQTLFWLVSGKPWVEANFKEDQLAKMKVGQPATIKVDAVSGHAFKGHVESFSPGSGQAFSPLPAQNATGNWVKVVQRLPVRIAFDETPPDMAGRAGLSAVVTVDVRPRFWPPRRKRPVGQMGLARNIAGQLHIAAGLAPIAALLAALAGCKAVGPDFQPPAASAASNYLMAGDTQGGELQLGPDVAGAGGWWKALGSADLDRVVDQALSGNRTLAEADATLEKAREEAAITRGAQAPQADFMMGPTGERINVASLGFTGFPNPTVLLYQVGGAVTYDLDLFGGERRATEAAEARAETQARRADAAYLTLTGQTGMAAVQIATYRGEIAAAEGAVADDQRLVDMTRKAEAAGGQPRSAITQATAQLAQDQAVLPQLRQQLAQSRHAMALLVGQAPSDWTAPDFNLSDFQAPATVPVALPSTLVRHRPDILAAEADLHAATADVGVATAKLYPDIKLSANLTQSALEPGNLFGYAASGWSVAAGLTQPIFHGGALKAGRRAAQAEARAALAHYQQTVLAAFTQVADVMQAVADDDAELAALARSETPRPRRSTTPRPPFAWAAARCCRWSTPNASCRSHAGRG